MDKHKFKLTQGREGSIVLVRVCFTRLRGEVKLFVFAPGEDIKMQMYCQPQISGEYWKSNYNNEKKTRKLLIIILLYL